MAVDSVVMVVVVSSVTDEMVDSQKCTWQDSLPLARMSYLLAVAAA